MEMAAVVVAVGWVLGTEAGSIPEINSQVVVVVGTRAALLMGSCTSHVPASQDGGTLLVGKRRSFRSPAAPCPSALACTSSTDKVCSSLPLPEVEETSPAAPPFSILVLQHKCPGQAARACKVDSAFAVSAQDDQQLRVRR